MKAYLVFIIFVTSYIQLESLAESADDSQPTKNGCRDLPCCSETKNNSCNVCSVCKDGCYMDNHDCKKKVGLGGECQHHDACATANASCRRLKGSEHDICKCNTNYYASNTGDKCIKAKCDVTTSICVNCSVNCSAKGFLEPCKNNTCLNNGRCFENSSKGIQLCQCQSNYYGPKCGIKICNATKCSNAGKCIGNSSKEHQCLCPRGYYGDHCEMTKCADSNCSNNGKCFVNRSSKHQFCVCSPNYYGQRCEAQICNATNCSNAGKCIGNSSKDYQCLCPRGYYGDHCEMKKCADSNCSDNGKCFVNRSSNHQFCVCSPNYYGRSCEARYKNDSTVSTEDKHNCSDNPNAAEVVSRQGDSEKQYTLGHVAIAAIVAFVLGILLVVAVLGICRLRSQGRLCFREKPQRYEGKWEGASNTVTTKVIEKHSLKREYKNKTYENNAIGDKVPFPDSTKDTYDSLSAVESNKPEHVYTGFKTDGPKASDNVGASPNPSMVQSDSGHVYTNLEKRSSHIYETTRDSNVSEHAYFSLSNENFRTSNNNLGTGQTSGNHLPTSNNENATIGTDDPVDTGPYSVLEKREETNGVKTETETQENNESPKSKENDDAYFILQKDGKDISQEGDVISNPYFTLEKEQ